jgi:hypothetical protein
MPDAAHAGRVDVAAVGLALLHHLGVAGDHLDAGRVGRLAHGPDNPGQVRDRESFLQDEARRQEQRGGPGHRQVVHRAVDGQVADAPAGEKERRHDVGIGREGQPRPANLQPRGVLERLEQRVAELVEEDRFDQGLGSLAPGPVRHRDPLFLDPRAAAAGPVDAFQHQFLADGARQRLRGTVAGAAGLLLARLLLVHPEGVGHPSGVLLVGGHDVVASLTLCRVRRP